MADRWALLGITAVVLMTVLLAWMPVEVPVIPGMNTIGSMPAPEPMPLRLTISRPAERRMAA